MKKITIIFTICIVLFSIACSQQISIQGKPDVLVKKFLKDDSTYVIMCKGYPKPGTTGIQATQTAKEAALLNAQYIARGIFSEEVDIIKAGIVDDYSINQDFVIITYSIHHPNIKRYLQE
ncbi:MAG: hypothetical protein N3F66_07540 [Spirochaetes bacterium]|nr:hypothetical protein [Spirochaetota bacterium]